jgi:hypothetical protein
MTYTEFKNKWLGKAIDWDKKYGAQCVDVYRQYCNELGFKQSPPVVGAKDIWGTYLKTDFDRVENTPTGIPPQGSVLIWGTVVGQYGHVAICDRATAKSFVSIDQNWPVDNGTGVLHEVTHNYNGLLGWLIPKSVIIDDMLTEDQKRALAILEGFKKEFNHGNLEGAISSAVGAAKDIPHKDEQILILTNKVHDLELQMAKFEQDMKEIKLNFIEKEKEVVSYQKKLTTANTNLSEQILKNEELDRLAKDNRNLYLQKNDEFNAYKLAEKENLKEEVIKEISIGGLFTLLVNKIFKK